MKTLILILVCSSLVYAEGITRREAAQLCLRGTIASIIHSTSSKTPFIVFTKSYIAEKCIEYAENSEVTPTKEDSCEFGINYGLMSQSRTELKLNDRFMSAMMSECLKRN